MQQIAWDEMPLTEKGRLWQRLGRTRFFRGFAVALGWRGFTAIDFIGFLKVVGGGPMTGTFSLPMPLSVMEGNANLVLRQRLLGKPHT